jgi:hypothetical protein
MSAESPREAPFVLKVLVACIAVQTFMLAYTITRSAERRGTTVVISTSGEGGPERGASCPGPRDPMVSFTVKPGPLEEKGN